MYDASERHNTAPAAIRIKHWPAGERPREKLFDRGADALSDAELLSLLIQSGSGRRSALDVAKSLITEYPSFSALARRTPAELARVPGLGAARVAAIVAALEIGRRMRIPSRDGQAKIRSPQDVAERFIPMLRDLAYEVFYVVLLNTSGHIIREIPVSKGTVNASIVHPREVFRHAVTELATSIVVVHNHPGGTEEPSREDREITRQLVDAGTIVGIPVRDHVIVCGEGYVSFAERGWIPDI
jgi:DNA repair protein RadC